MSHPLPTMGLRVAHRRTGPGGDPLERALRVLKAGGVVVTSDEVEHSMLEGLAKQGGARLAATKGHRKLWNPTPRLIQAGLADELQRKMRAVLSGPYDFMEARRVGEWFDSNFRVDSPKTPRGGKQLKNKGQHLSWVLKHRVVTGTPQQLKHPLTGEPMGKTPEDVFKSFFDGDTVKQQETLDKAQAEVRAIWAEVEPQMPLLLKFTDEGGTVVPKELKIGTTTFQNKAGLSETNLKKYAKRLSTLFKSLTGWRSKALKGGLTVVMASPKDFRGTAGGKYKRDEDALYVRTTPAVLKRATGYASFDYILIHELGHRYERYNYPSIDFDRPEWWTTRYSRTDGMGGSESFAELFALGHFRLTGNWDQSIVERFESVMSGGSKE